MARAAIRFKADSSSSAKSAIPRSAAQSMTTNATRSLGRLSGLESTAPSAPGRNRTCDTRFRKRRVEFCAAVERISPEAVARRHVSPSRPRFAPCTCNGCTGLAGEDGKPLSAGTVLNTHLVLTMALGHGWRTAPCQSRPTAGSSPTTQPSYPGRITKASPGLKSNSVPSSITMRCPPGVQGEPTRTNSSSPDDSL